ncbi:hypothetical protein ACFFQF_04965 [Haladaptatus pallidirubidus]|uniref:Transcriptional regulator n=1 Tax=Haladaptatus pallidirubidus TaxID=1008152 RepID=A0AAV3ULU8_9EURY|nr:hypothetical protein [Haladaptatus pallidirubidus]
MLESLQDEVEITTRTVEILLLIRNEEPVGLRHASTVADLPEHRVRTSFQMLEKEGLIQPTDDGAVTTDRTGPFLDTFDDEIEAVRASVERLGAGMAD